MDELKKDTTVTRSVLASAQTMIELQQQGNEHIMTLMSNIRRSYSAMFDQVHKYKLPTSKRYNLWVLFHSFSLNEGYHMCIDCDKALNLNASEMFWQLLLEKEFIRLVIDFFSQTVSPTLGICTSKEFQFTNIEENAIRYTAGYVIRKTELKYSKQKTQEGIQCTTALREMGGILSTRLSASTHHSMEWTAIVDCGGLYHIEDIAYYLFVALELVADKKLTDLLNKKGQGIDKTKKGNLTWLCDDEEVQSAQTQ